MMDQREDAPDRYTRGTTEFDRVATLSDGIFAIAMTLLVFGLDVPGVSGRALVDALTDNTWQFVAFFLSFAVIARFWWMHHRFVGLLGAFEPGLIALNLAFLAGIALMPFTTALIGETSLSNVAVLIYLSLLGAITLAFMSLLMRARTAAAFRRPLPEALWPYLLSSWFASIAVILVAMVVAVWLPIAGLVLLALLLGVDLLFGWLAPEGYHDWV